MGELVRILSLSGGGIRGVLQTAFLERLEADLGAPLSQHFDLICGTSTGGIVALAIARGVPASEMSDLYRHHGPAIFAPRFASWLRRGGRYRQEPLANALKERFGNARFSDLNIEALVTSSGLETFSGQTFSTGRDPDISLVDAALATSAAPIYFPPTKVAASRRSFMDGGLWANDPSLVGILHAQHRLGAHLSDVRLLSIGTGHHPKGATVDEVSALHSLSFGSIRFVYEFLMSAQASFSDLYARSILPEGSYQRVNPQLTTRVGLDDVSRALQVLPPLAEQYYVENQERLLGLFEDWKRLPVAGRSATQRRIVQSRSTARPVVYWCGPHNDQTNYDMKSALENHGFAVRLPDELASALKPSLTSAERAASIQRICCRAIEESSVVAVNLATYGLDSAWEMGYAEALGKVVIGYDRSDDLVPAPRKVNKRFYRDNFMHGWEGAYSSTSLDELSIRCRGKVVYLFCPYKNEEAIKLIKGSLIHSVSSTLIISNERLGLDPLNPRAYSQKARFRAIQFLHQADVILTVLPRYGMDTAWKMGYASALGKELIGWDTDEFGSESSEADYLDHWMHGWRKKPVVSTIADLATFIRGT